MNELWYGYIKPNDEDNAKLRYMDTDSFVIHIKTEDFYEDIANYAKNGLTHQTIVKMIKDHFQEVLTKK